MKSLVLLLCFTLLFSCNGSKSKTDNSKIKEDCVSKIFIKDSLLGGIRNHASENISLSETIENYSDSVLSLDFKDCPEEFKIAFHNHIEAWLEMRKVTDKNLELRGELHTIFEELEISKDSTEFKSHLKKIFDTWEIVEIKSKQGKTSI